MTVGRVEGIIFGTESKMKSLLESFGIRFRRHELLEEALRHASYCSEQGSNLPSNERLEFLGDAVVGLAVADWLVKRCPYWEEGGLTKARSTVVSQDGLAKVARQLGLAKHVKMGKAEKEAGLQGLPKILACAFEATVGAVYVDAGYERAKEFAQEVLGEALEEALAMGPAAGDAKSRLQILAQEVHRELPVYGTLLEEGPGHQKMFTVSVSLKGRRLATGKGRSKKEAEQQAAAAALEALGEETQGSAEGQEDSWRGAK